MSPLERSEWPRAWAAAGLGALWLASAAQAEPRRAPAPTEAAVRTLAGRSRAPKRANTPAPVPPAPSTSTRGASAPGASTSAPGTGAAEASTPAPVLERAELVRQVLERNPGIEAARAGWQAALARRAQATTLEETMLRYEVAPLTVLSGHSRFGQVIELSQRLPFPGKRGLAGQVASAEAEAARGDFEAMRLELALMASMLYDDLFVVHRALAINDAHRVLLEGMRRSAEAQYVVGRASQQDPLQAEVELGMLQRDRLMLESERDVLRAQLNGLMHRLPQEPLPSPPERLEVPEGPLPSSEALQEEALRQRPELAGMRARLGGGEAAVGLARREYYPDVRVMGSYSSMWPEAPHRLMAGISLELPNPLSRRSAVSEAEAMLQGMRREEARLVDELRVQVEQARIRLGEALRAVALYRDRLLPAVRDQVAAARAGFEAGRNGFQVVLEAERNLRGVELRFEEAIADVQRRQSELYRAVGRVPGLAQEGSRP